MLKAEGKRSLGFTLLPQGLKPLNLFMNKVGNTASLLNPLNSFMGIHSCPLPFFVTLITLYLVVDILLLSHRIHKDVNFGLSFQENYLWELMG